MLRRLTYHSYAIIKIAFALMLMVTAFARYVFEIEISLPITAVFFLISGIYVGYTVAYYSIKYLREEGIKKRLPLN